MSEQKIIEIINGVARQPLFRMKNPINISITDQYPIAILGLNGAGKTMLVDILTCTHPLLLNDPAYDFSPRTSKKLYDNLKYITFRDTYGDTSESYYQQRWNHGDKNNSPLIAELLSYDENNLSPVQQKLMDVLQIPSILNKELIMLSSGEMRRFQLAKSLQELPRVLIIDNPYIGLDPKARTEVTEILEQIASQGECLLILVVSRKEDIPHFIKHCIYVKNRYVSPGMPISQVKENTPQIDQKHLFELQQKPSNLSESIGPSEEIVRFNHIHIHYGGKNIINDLCWNIKRGEKWALNGENGAGKSTLLSLICADNPQAYACDITLFGKKRGSGESIWDIKKKIGYISPEMYRAYKKDISCIKLVASGFHDSVGLYKQPTSEEMAQCEWWMDLFQISDLKERPYLRLSSGEQRMVLLARAFVKDPELLILDEPFHGLDNANRSLAKEIINVFCQRPGKTLIMVSHYEDEYPKCITHKLYLKRNH